MSLPSKKLGRPTMYSVPSRAVIRRVAGVVKVGLTASRWEERMSIEVLDKSEDTDVKLGWWMGVGWEGDGRLVR